MGIMQVCAMDGLFAKPGWIEKKGELSTNLDIYRGFPE